MEFCDGSIRTDTVVFIRAARNMDDRPLKNMDVSADYGLQENVFLSVIRGRVEEKIVYHKNGFKAVFV
jgi:hypothetical protein